MIIAGWDAELTDGSHRSVTVVCDAQASEKCKRAWTKSWKTVVRDRTQNEGKDLCLFCSRKLKFSGVNNPNCQHRDVAENILESIDDEAKAYLLGWVASVGSLSSESVCICIDRKDTSILYDLRDLVGPSLPLDPRAQGKQISLTISRTKLVNDACRHLGLIPGAKSAAVQFPKLENDTLTWAFIRGLFDGDGSVSDPKSSPTPACKIASTSEAMRNGISAFVKIPCRVHEGGVDFEGTNALDFLSRIYDGSALALQRKKELYRDWATWTPQIGGPGQSGFQRPMFRWARLHPDAVPPSKTRASDSGYDITIIGDREEDRGQLVRYYRTGIRISCMHGWYFDLVPRSSISKTGYMVANSFGVIDRSYRGELLIALRKVDPSAPDLTFPIRLMQLIPRPVIHLEFIEEDDLEETDRGAGGFGSTGAR